MKFYAKPGQAPPASQMIQVVHSQVPYRLDLVHTTLDQKAVAVSKHREHSHNIFHINLYTNSKGNFSLEGLVKNAEEGALVLVSPGQKHDFSSTKKKAAYYSELTFAMLDQDGKELVMPMDRMLSLYFGVELNAISDFPVNLGKDRFFEMMGIFRHFFELLETRQAETELLCQFEILKMLLFIMKHVYLEKAGETSGEDRLYIARNYIIANYNESFSIGELADVALLSPGHLQRMFKAKFDTTPMTYQRQLRINAAKNLLASSSLPCKAVAARVGYEDICHFYKAFKKVTGLPPMKYAKKLRL